jgi:hypothetical protein
MVNSSQQNFMWRLWHIALVEYALTAIKIVANRIAAM